jgi:hypothetical protein
MKSAHEPQGTELGPSGMLRIYIDGAEIDER